MDWIAGPILFYHFDFYDRDISMPLKSATVISFASSDWHFAASFTVRSFRDTATIFAFRANLRFLLYSCVNLAGTPCMTTKKKESLKKTWKINAIEEIYLLWQLGFTLIITAFAWKMCQRRIPSWNLHLGPILVVVLTNVFWNLVQKFIWRELLLLSKHQGSTKTPVLQ